VANRIVEITTDGIIDVMMDFDEYLVMKEESQDEEEQDYLEMKAA
jgi:hypothetical protein